MKSKIANSDILLIAQENFIKLWEIAVVMNISETELKKKLQRKLTKAEKLDILDAMDCVLQT